MTVTAVHTHAAKELDVIYTLIFFPLTFLCFSLLFTLMICYCLLCRDFPHNLIANILVSLTLKDSIAGLKFLLSADGVER